MDKITEEIEGFSFPCQFALKAMGKADPEFMTLILEMVQAHAPEVTTEHCACKVSKNGKFHSITVTFEAQSKAQMDAIYQLISNHEKVLFSL